MLLLDFEGGDQTLAGLDIDMVRVRDWADYNAVYTELKTGKSPYRSLGIDSISETHIFALLSLLEASAGQRADPNLLQQQDYGKAQIQLRRLMRYFRDLPLHVFFTATDKSDVEPRVGTVKLPALSGQMAKEVVSMMDVCGYLALSQEQVKVGDGTKIVEVRSLLLKGFSQFAVKIRTGWDVQDVPDYLDDPSIEKLLDILEFPKPSEEEAA